MGAPGKHIARVARESFGWDELRPGQAEAAAAVIDGRDTLAVMSTGYGKSAIYQIAAVLIPGPTVVVSPLLALQRDQVQELDAQAAGGAANVNSLVSEGEREEAFDDLREDQLEFLFLTPEQFSNDEVLAAVAAALGRPPILALTATASPPVREEIADRLAMRDPEVLVRGFDRPNIWL